MTGFAYAAVIVLVPPLVRDHPEFGLAGLLCGDRSQYKNTGTDDRADPEHGEVTCAQLSLEPLSLR